MPWFKTDDGFWRHPKVRRLGKDRLPAVGLWELAGTWCCDNIATNVTDGFVPTEQVDQWDPKHRYAKRLVDVGLWTAAEVDGEAGYLFHDWTDYNPTRADIEAEREEWRTKKAAQRKGRRTSTVSREVSPGDANGDSSGNSPVDNSTDSVTKRSTSTVTNGPTEESIRLSTGDTENGAATQQSTPELDKQRPTSTEPKVSPGDTQETPAKTPQGSPARVPDPIPVPVPYMGHLGEGGATFEARANAEPPPLKCPKHIKHDTDRPCHACGQARKAHEEWWYLQERRAASIAAEVDAARADPDMRCKHGADGGLFKHPVTGKSATCQFCRAESTRDTA